MKKLDLIKIKIAMWLLSNKSMSLTTARITKSFNELRCEHCGLHPTHFLDNCSCEGKKLFK